MSVINLDDSISKRILRLTCEFLRPPDGFMIKTLEMNRLVLLSIALIWLSISSTTALGCTCGEYGRPVCADYWRSEAVFVGLVSEIARPSGNAGVGTISFVVEEPFRGVSAPTVNVEAMFGTSCDIGFAKGQHYLVYANRNSEYTGLFAAACAGTTTLEEARDDLNYIRSLTQQGVTESIAGRVGMSRYEPLAGVKVEVQNESRSFETTSDEKGNYSVSLAGPGTYRVRVLVPSAVKVMLLVRQDLYSKVEPTDTLTTIEYNVDLKKNECDYRDFDLDPVDLHATAEISGIVVDASGRPLNKGNVYLLHQVDDSNRHMSAKIEANGSFKFNEIAVGEYFLVLNPDNKVPGETDSPYARAFYPNGSDASDATRIVVAEGAKLENLTLRVGPPLKARTVSGRVIWKEGGAVTDGYLSLYGGDEYLHRIDVDKKGRFSFKIYGDFKYAIQARVQGQRQGKSDRVAITDKSTNLMLVLKPD